MLPLNPFLSAFFKSSLPAQCAQTHQYILLVPTTDVLLASREIETGASTHDLLQSEEFLGSHVLRIPGAGAGGKDTVQNLREMRGKARQYSTLNGRSVVIKDGYVYSNKGFKAPNEAQLLHDSLWYSDTLDWKQWLIYYISKPLIGTWREAGIPSAVLVEGMAKKARAEQNGASSSESKEGTQPRKKDVKFFHDLLNHFPIIARHMQPGLEKMFREYTTAFERPLPPPPSAADIPDPEPDGPIVTAMKKARTNSTASATSNGDNGSNSLPITENFYAENDEDAMRASLESAITAAIDLFQNVDKQQLSMLGTTTDLTGPAVEKMIERYVTENVHHLLFPRLCLLKRPYDLELEAKIRQMEFIDVSQLGILILGGAKGKHELIIQLSNAVDEFRKMSNAMCPQEMLELLVSTMKTVTKVTGNRTADLSVEPGSSSEKTVLTVNADTLVSLLLFVVIRAQIKNLQARLTYIRQFIFVDDIDSGEAGYALSTFEAVLAYLALDSGGLRRASRRNKALWDATSKGQLDEVKKIMEPTSDAIDDEEEDDDEPSMPSSSSRRQSRTWSITNGSSKRSSTILTATERFSLGSGLGHVFPFQNSSNHEAAAEQFILPPIKRLKKVSMDTRSLSSGSEYSFRSRATSFGSLGSALEGDISAERLSQTHDAFGESVPMMAVQHERPAVLRYLLSLPQYYPLQVILEDINNEDTTLLSAAVQLGNTHMTDMILDFVMGAATPEQISKFFGAQDIWGRSVGHYLFHAPSLISKIGKFVPWRQRDKNGQTPLFALCRSYDQASYSSMVAAGLDAARRAQNDGEPLHIDDHVDAKGNTLLHIVTDAPLVLRILHNCDVDVNATNEKRFTPLMLASKYGRYDMVRVLFSDPRVDLAARELRGLTAVELAKDDDVRNRIDDLALFSMQPATDDRITGVVRAFFVEDGTVRLVLKSAAPNDHRSYTVTTCRRSLMDFEALASLLAMENPSSWIPSITVERSPFQIPAKPSRAMLKDIQMRTDWFLKIMLTHPTFAAHETLWEFFLVPEIRLDMMTKRSKLKAETLEEKIKDELEPVEDVREVEQFVNHAREMVRSVNHSTKSVTRRANRLGVAASDLYDASNLLQRAVSTVEFLPQSHQSAFETYVRTLSPTQGNPHAVLHASLIAQQSTITALLSALSRPPQLIAQIASAQKTTERNYNSIGRSSRWPLGLLDDTRQRMNEEREEKARKSQQEVDDLSRKLRHAQQVVASELAGWQDMHERMGRRAVREFANGMLVQERVRLAGMMRALRKFRAGGEAMQSANSPISQSPGQGEMPGETPMPTLATPASSIMSHSVLGSGQRVDAGQSSGGEEG